DMEKDAGGNNPGQCAATTTLGGYGLRTGMVEETLDADGKPVVSSCHAHITSANSFCQWYRDVPDNACTWAANGSQDNQRFDQQLTLTAACVDGSSCGVNSGSSGSRTTKASCEARAGCSWVYTFQDTTFFPINNQGFGNEG